MDVVALAQQRGLGLEETNAGALETTCPFCPPADAPATGAANTLYLDLRGCTPCSQSDWRRGRSRRLGHKLDRARMKLLLGDEAGAKEDVAAVAEEFADRPAVTFDALMKSIRGQD